VLDLIASLRGGFRVACLSNCNELHWPRFLDEMGLAPRSIITSPRTQLGAMKPDRKIFRLAVGEARRHCRPRSLPRRQPAERRRARAAGSTRRWRGSAGIRSTLGRLGVLLP
jgi:hypothetical protein